MSNERKVMRVGVRVWAGVRLGVRVRQGYVVASAGRCRFGQNRRTNLQGNPRTQRPASGADGRDIMRTQSLTLKQTQWRVCTSMSPHTLRNRGEYPTQQNLHGDRVRKCTACVCNSHRAFVACVMSRSGSESNMGQDKAGQHKNKSTQTGDTKNTDPMCT